MKKLVLIAAAVLPVAAHAGFFVTEEPPVRPAPSPTVPVTMSRPASAAVATAAPPTAVIQPGATSGLSVASVPAANVGGFTLLAVDTRADGIEEGGVRAEGLALSTAEDPTGALAASYLCEAASAVYLIRPDQHVAARWDSFDEGAIRAALRHACAKE